jgi:hypothetical protein
MTVQPSVPFWDCGEFTAATTWQQVPHPPGAPLFLMVGRLFQVIIPFGDLGWRVNMLSVFATALSIWLLYLIIVKVIMNFRKEPVENLADALAVCGSALVGALAFCFCDTVWFNGVESEVYASSTLFVAIVVYLMMRWNEEADNPGHERFLIAICYLILLSTGVHLLSILTIYSVVFLVYFRLYKVTVKSFLITCAVGLFAFFFIYLGMILWIPTMLGGELPFRNEAKEYIVSDNFLVSMLPIIAAIIAFAGFWYGRNHKKAIMQLITYTFLLMMFGYTTQLQIVVRSNANPPMNENAPKDFNKLSPYIGREQYGESPYWPRRWDSHDESKMAYYKQYGQWNPPEMKRVMRKDGSEAGDLVFDKINTSGELNYLFKYQIKHMFIRYFWWNFVGKVSDVQDADEAWFGKDDSDILNYKSGYAKDFPIKFFALPFLFGLIGFYYHSKKDWKVAGVYFIMFLLMGVLAAIAQNQLQQQPRERDYFYAGAFMVFCLWIGVGVSYFLELLKEKVFKKKLTPVIVGGVIALSLLCVPVNMGAGGWRVHSRAGNWLPFDFAYNILQSCEKDAILFTVGDNDTFPLWYLQDVEGVRRDIRIVNLSLGGTRWYVNILKNSSPWGAKPIPLSFTDESLQCPDDDPKALTYDVSEPMKINIPISKDLIRQYTTDTTALNNPSMNFTFYGDETGQENKYYYHISHKLILDIFRQTKMERPIYFSVTAGSDVYRYGLSKYLRYEGMTMRVMPIESKYTEDGQFNSKVMQECLVTNVDNSNNYSTEPHFGFKFRGLNDMSVYFDDVHRRYLDTYKQIYLNFASYMIDKKQDSKMTVAILDEMNKNVSPVQFPLMYDEEINIAKLYKQAGAMDRAKEFADMCIKDCEFIKSHPKFRTGRVHSMAAEIVGRNGEGTYKCEAESYIIAGDYTAAKNVLNDLYQQCKPYLEQAGNEDQKQSEELQRNVADIFRLMVYADDMALEGIEKQYGKKAAADSANAMRQQYEQSPDPLIKSLLTAYSEQAFEKYTGKAPVKDSAFNQ